MPPATGEEKMTSVIITKAIHNLAKNIINLKQAKEMTGIKVRTKEDFYDAAFAMRDELEAKGL